MAYTSKIESIYTDGACTGNPGPGGWGVVVYFTDGSVYELGGAETHTTNNKMELQAAIAALKILPQFSQDQSVVIYTDSEYVKKGITQWVKGWKKKGWQTSQGTPVLNRELWQTLDQLNSNLINWEYVRGHAGNKGNERADAIARSFALGKTPSLKQITTNEEFCSPGTSATHNKTLQSSSLSSDPITPDFVMVDSNASLLDVPQDNLPREARVNQLRNLIETLRIADEIAAKGHFITSSELADLMDVNASAVTSRGDNWVWRNWIVSRVRREGNQILWQLERVDQVKVNEENNSDHATA